MLYREDTDQTEVTNYSVFIPVDNEPQSEKIEESPTYPPEPRKRSIRSTTGQPPVKYAKVNTFGVTSNASNQPWYKQNIFIP